MHGWRYRHRRSSGYALRARSMTATPRGEFIHAYTEIISGQVFFEIVQRINGYAGYGEINAPIRMAAHRRARLNRQG